MRQLLMLTLTLAGCIKAPMVVIADRQTVLEEQASVPFRQLEEELDRAGVSPRPVPFTRGQVEQQGGDAGRLALQPQVDETEDEVVDRLLVRRCLGEARDGTLAETRPTCSAAVDPQLLGQLVERQNRTRFQLWRFLQQQRPGASIDDVRREWRRLHLEGVVCQGQVQGDDGTWGVKECERR